MRFMSYSEMKVLRNKKITIFGAGRNINHIISLLDSSSIVGVYDNDEDKFGNYVGGNIIEAPRNVIARDFDYCIVNSLNYFVIENQLWGYGICNKKMIVPPVELFYS